MQLSFFLAQIVQNKTAGLGFDLSRSSFCIPYHWLLVIGFKVKTVGPGRQPGDFLSKAKESHQRTLCAALGTSCLGWSVC